MTAKNDDIVELYYENFYVEIVDYDDCVRLDNGMLSRFGYFHGSFDLEHGFGSGSGIESESGSGKFGTAKTEIQISEDDDCEL